ncbi:MAG: NAD(P)-dependent oxidoreductase [Ruthenibacterium sp.]
MSKVLVTGAGGYIGRHVVKAVLDRGHEVIASDFSFKGIDERASFCGASIFSQDANLFEQLGSPDICIHLAWRDGFIHNSDAHMDDLSKHVLFLNHMLRAGIKGLSVMGTMHEIGYWEGAIDAKTPCNPLSQYGIAKNALRQSMLLTAEKSDVALHWLRAYYITGDDIRGSSIFAKIIQAAEDGKKLFPFTTGKNQYDFIDVKELAQQIAVTSLQNEYTGIINVCTGKPMTLAARVEKFIAENQLDIKLQYGAFPDRPYDSTGVWGDAALIQEIMRKYGQ